MTHRRSNSKRFTVLGFAGIIMVTAMLVGSASWAKPVKIRIGWVNTPTEVHYMLFKKTDLMKHYGKSYVTEFTKFKGSPPQIQALGAKELDIAALAFSTIGIAVINANLPVRVVSSLAKIGAGGKNPLAWMVRPDSGINKIADLRGKIVSTNAIGSGVDILMRVQLRKHGLQIRRDYTITEAGLPHQRTFLKEKKIDMAVFTNPWRHMTLKAGEGRILFEGSQPLGGLQFLILVGRNEFVDAHRDVMVDFYEDYMRALEWFMNPANRKAVLALIAKVTKRSEKVYAPWFLTDTDYQRSRVPVADASSLQRAIDAMVEHKFLKKSVDISKFVDNSFVEAAAKRLGKK